MRYHRVSGEVNKQRALSKIDSVFPKVYLYRDKKMIPEDSSDSWDDLGDEVTNFQTTETGIKYLYIDGVLEIFIPETHPWFNITICHILVKDRRFDEFMNTEGFYYEQKFLPEDIRSITIS